MTFWQAKEYARTHKEGHCMNTIIINKNGRTWIPKGEYIGSVEEGVLLQCPPPTEAEPDGSFIRNSLIESRSDGPPIFHTLADGHLRVTIDGYAIVPYEKYQTILRNSNLYEIESRSFIFRIQKLFAALLG
jgi:hypothetical protein